MSYTLIAKCGNLLTEDNATFIVNASNTTLLLGSGVSMAFKRHCGIELQTEMIQRLESIGEPLQKGDVIATSSGNATNFIYSLHAAIMDYNPGIKYSQKNPTLQTIKTVLENIENYLEWYAENKQKSIKLVLPLIGCGVGGLDKIDVINIYKIFFSKSIDYSCEVIVYGYDKEDYSLVRSQLYSLQK